MAGHTFQVSAGIPRMRVARSDDRDREAVELTAGAFGDQWTRFAAEATVGRSDLELHMPTGLGLDAFRGAVLDVGCGMGRYTALVRGLGASVIGLDASRSVDAAHSMWPNVPFVQADIAAPPFDPETFDVVYSLGVLHHLPDPLRGLHQCYSLVKPGGLLLVWVYSQHRGVFRGARRIARRVVKRIPSARFGIAVVASLVILTLLSAGDLGLRSNKFEYFRGKKLEQIRVDCYDALSAPTEIYLSEPDCKQWVSSLGAASAGYERRSDGSGWIIWAIKPFRNHR
jgi:SAM-dependent methyltransferase